MSAGPEPPPSGPSSADALPYSGSRVEGFSDGVFGFAATLLVVSIDIPSGLDDQQLHDALVEAIPSLAMYALSFWVITRIWLGHHRLVTLLDRFDGRIVTLNLLLLGVVALIPFPTELLGEYDNEAAIILYATVMTMAMSLVGSMSWWAKRAGLGRPSTTSADFEVGIVAAGATAVAFATSIPLALLFGSTTAQLWWLTLLPLQLAGTRWARRRATAATLTGPATTDGGVTDTA